VPISRIVSLYAFTGRDSRSFKHLYAVNPNSFGDCFTDLSLILLFVCKKKCAILADFQSVDGSARWQTTFNFNHTPHAGTLPSTGHCRPTVQLLLCLPVLQRRKHFVVVKKPHRSCCHQKLINKIKPTILGADTRLVE